MNILAPAFLNSDDFLRWNEGREGRRELVRGKVVEAVVGASRRHVLLATSLLVLLGARLDPDAFDLGSADFGVKTKDGVRYPDVFVDRAVGKPKDLAAREPLFLAEILSPASLAVDFREKADEYTTLPSLAHYLVLSQDEPRVWLWSRDEAGRFMAPAMIVGREETVPLPGLGLTLPLGAVYRGVA